MPKSRPRPVPTTVVARLRSPMPSVALSALVLALLLIGLAMTTSLRADTALGESAAAFADGSAASEGSSDGASDADIDDHGDFDRYGESGQRETEYAESEVAIAPPPAAGPWPQWRGPARDGRVGGPTWPADLRGLEKSWRVPLGPSYSGPIVTEDRVFTTETRDEKDEVVTAYDRRTGEQLWTHHWKGSMKVPFFAARNGSWIRSTPAWDGETLYVGGIREVLVAIDGETGKEKWSFDFPGRMGSTPPPFGFVCSPLLVNGRLFVEAGSTVLELDRETGEPIWRSDDFSDGSMASDGTFSSPVMATLAGMEQLLVQTRHRLVGIDPSNGKVLWGQPIPSFRGMNILTPLVVGDRIFTSTYKNASYVVEVTRDEEGAFQAREVWQNNAQAYMSSPVLVDGLVYLHLGNGRLTALDIDQNQRLWTTTPFGPYWSMIAQDDRILALDAEGELILFEGSREGFELIDRREVATSETWAHVAVAEDQIFVRELDGLTAWQWNPGVAESTEGAGAPASETTAP